MNANGVKENQGQDVKDESGHTLIHFHLSPDSSHYKEYVIWLQNLIGYDSLHDHDNVPWSDACNVRQA